MMSGVSVESFWNISAAAAATIGVAILVPLNRVYLPLRPVEHVLPSRPRMQVVIGCMFRLVSDVTRELPGEANETILFPGATRSGFATWSSSVGPLEL